MLDEPDYETAYVVLDQHGAGPRWSAERDEARDNVDERIVELQSEAGTIYESLSISFD